VKGLCQIDSGSIFVCFIIDCNSLSALIVESLIVDQNVTVWMVIQTVMIIFLKFCDLLHSIVWMFLTWHRWDDPFLWVF
jgi:hypothetical protein